MPWLIHGFVNPCQCYKFECRIFTDYFVLLRLRILLYLHKQLICFIQENRSIWLSKHEHKQENWCLSLAADTFMRLALHRWRGLSFYKSSRRTSTIRILEIKCNGCIHIGKWMDSTTFSSSWDLKDPSANISPVIKCSVILMTPSSLQL